MPADPLQDFRATFFVECDDLIESLQDALQTIEAGVADGEAVNVVFRAVHSIKGGAGAFGFDDLVGFAHRLETVLDGVRSGRIGIGPDTIALFYQGADLLHDHVRAARDGGAPPPGAAPLLTALEALLGRPGEGGVVGPDCEALPPAPGFSPLPLALAPAPFAPIPFDPAAFEPVSLALTSFESVPSDDTPSGSGPTSPGGTRPAPPFARSPAGRGWHIRLTPQAGLYRSGNDVGYLLRGLSEIGDVQVHCDLPDDLSLEDSEVEAPRLGWTVLLQPTAAGAEIDRAEIDELFDFVADVCTVSITPEAGEDRVSVAASAPHPAPVAAAEPAARSATESPAQPPAPPAPFDVAPDDPGQPMPPGVQHDMTTDPRPVATDRAPGTAAASPLAALPITPPRGSPAAAVSPAAALADGGTPTTRAVEPGPERGTAEVAPITVRVDLDKIDRLLNLVGELVINQAMLSQSITAAGLASPEVMSGLDAFQSLTRDIQDGVMSVRAQPVKPLFQRLARVVREAAGSVGKLVRLQTEGEATEVDKTLIERLVEPLTHIIRNAVDHGLEAPEARLAVGKPAEGRITLSALHRAGRILIEVSDDGAGIDRDRVRSIAASRGLIPQDAVLTEAETDNLLFLPGFSTASQVSALSGRGVGMDVVKSTIAALSGRISIASTRGAGTTLSISLPLTLAVLDGMVVSAAGQTFVIPLSAIVETARLDPEAIMRVGLQGELLQMRGDLIPLIDLAARLGFRPPDPSDRGGIVLLTSQDGGSRAALIVDAIMEQRQVVIKGIGPLFGPIAGVAAATILGDGQIALILDPADLTQKTRTLGMATGAVSSAGMAPGTGGWTTAGARAGAATAGARAGAATAGATAGAASAGAASAGAPGNQPAAAASPRPRVTTPDIALAG